MWQVAILSLPDLVRAGRALAARFSEVQAQERTAARFAAARGPCWIAGSGSLRRHGHCRVRRLCRSKVGRREYAAGSQMVSLQVPETMPIKP